MLINVFSFAESLSEANQPQDGMLGDQLVATKKILDVESVSTLE
jgi:hypothetical protein